MSVVRCFLLLALMFPSVAIGQTYPLRGENGVAASAVCLGVMRDHDGSNPRYVFLTNRHFFRSTNVVWVGGEDLRWHSGRDVRINTAQADLASFSVTGEAGWFRKIVGVRAVPSGTDAVVCGYTPERKSFCFPGVIRGSTVVSSGLHVLPGDSGGPVMVRGKDTMYLAGLIYGYGVRDRSTRFATVAEISDHIETSYGRTPRCVPWAQSRCPPFQPESYRYGRTEPKLFRPPQLERYEFPPDPPDPLDSPDIKKLVAQAVASWMDSHAISDVDVDIQALSRHIIDNHADQIRGPETDLSQIEQRLSVLEDRRRTLILREDGREIDRQEYRDDQPIILDLQRFMRSE